MDFEPAFALAHDFAAKALRDNPQGFDPVVFSFRGANLDKTEVISIPWPLEETDLKLLRDQFAATGVTGYVLVVCQQIRLEGVDGDYALFWACTRGTCEGRAFEYADGTMAEGYRELAATVRAKAFRLLADGPELTPRQAVRVRRELARQSKKQVN